MVTITIELVRGYDGTNDRDACAAPGRRRRRSIHPYDKGTLDDGELDLLDGDGLVGNAEHKITEQDKIIPRRCPSQPVNRPAIGQ